MSQVIILDLHLSLRAGKLEDSRALAEEISSSIEPNEPGTSIYEWFIGQDDSAVHLIERYADSSVLMAHLANFGSNYAERFMGCFEIVSFSVYGNPSAEVKEVLDSFGAVYLAPLAGFSR